MDPFAGLIYDTVTQPSAQPRLSDLPLELPQGDRCAFGRGTRRLRLRSIAECGRESYRASQRCSRRQPFPAFEQRHSDGTRIVTIKILFQNIARPIRIRDIKTLQLRRDCFLLKKS